MTPDLPGSPWLLQTLLRVVLLCAAGALVLGLVLRGHRATVHWPHVAMLAQRHPGVIVSQSLFEIDRQRLSCGGHQASRDLIIAWLAQRHGHRFGQEVAGVMELGMSHRGEHAEIETFLGRLYVTDVGANQIFRYDPGRYEQPALWFQPGTAVNLAGSPSGTTRPSGTAAPIAIGSPGRAVGVPSPASGVPTGGAMGCAGASGIRGGSWMGATMAAGGTTPATDAATRLRPPATSPSPRSTRTRSSWPTPASPRTSSTTSPGR